MGQKHECNPPCLKFLPMLIQEPSFYEHILGALVLMHFPMVERSAYDGAIAQGPLLHCKCIFKIGSRNTLKHCSCLCVWRTIVKAGIMLILWDNCIIFVFSKSEFEYNKDYDL